MSDFKFDEIKEPKAHPRAKLTLRETLEIAGGKDQSIELTKPLSWELVIENGEIVNIKLIKGTLLDFLKLAGISESTLWKMAERPLKIAQTQDDQNQDKS
jgi:hypothetical protein